MKENDDKELITKDSLKGELKILFRIGTKVLSIHIPKKWRVSKVKKFIEHQFFDLIPRDSQISLVFGGVILDTEETIYDIFKVIFLSNFKDKKEDPFSIFVMIKKAEADNKENSCINNSMAAGIDPYVPKEEIVTDYLMK